MEKKISGQEYANSCIDYNLTARNTLSRFPYTKGARYVGTICLCVPIALSTLRN